MSKLYRDFSIQCHFRAKNRNTLNVIEMKSCRIVDYLLTFQELWGVCRCSFPHSVQTTTATVIEKRLIIIM